MDKPHAPTTNPPHCRPPHVCTAAVHPSGAPPCSLQLASPACPHQGPVAPPPPPHSAGSSRQCHRQAHLHTAHAQRSQDAPHTLLDRTMPESWLIVKLIQGRDTTQIPPYKVSRHKFWPISCTAVQTVACQPAACALCTHLWSAALCMTVAAGCRCNPAPSLLHPQPPACTTHTRALDLETTSGM